MCAACRLRKCEKACEDVGGKAGGQKCKCEKELRLAGEPEVRNAAEDKKKEQ